MRVTFVLPGEGARPVGGFKVVYEYANELAARGHRVTVIHAACLPPDRGYPVVEVSTRMVNYGIKRVSGSWRPRGWFVIHPRVRMRWIPWLHPLLVPDSDAIVATWWHTAELIARWPERKGRKYYLLQSLETWGGPEDRVLSTWRLPLEKIVISRWLKEVADGLGEHCHYIPNGLRFDRFGADEPAASRDPYSVAMLYHTAPWKGSRDGLVALRLAKSSLPKLHAELFGTCTAPAALPDWISYRREPPQRELRALYNRAAAFVAPSWTEGWALPPSEALACGCALVCTDIGGHRDYAVDGVTALMSPPNDPVALARNLVRVATDGALRLALSEQGRRLIQQFTWERAVDRFEPLLRLEDGSAPASPTRGGDAQDDCDAAPSRL